MKILCTIAAAIVFTALTVLAVMRARRIRSRRLSSVTTTASIRQRLRPGRRRLSRKSAFGLLQENCVR